MHLKNPSSPSHSPTGGSHRPPRRAPCLGRMPHSETGSVRQPGESLGRAEGRKMAPSLRPKCGSPYLASGRQAACPWCPHPFGQPRAVVMERGTLGPVTKRRPPSLRWQPDLPQSPLCLLGSGVLTVPVAQAPGSLAAENSLFQPPGLAEERRGGTWRPPQFKPH